MTELIIGFLVVVGIFCFVMVLVSFSLAGDNLFKVKKGNIIQRYLKNAQMLSKVKKGERHPWQSNYHSDPIDADEYYMLKVIGFVWSFMPLIVLVVIGLLIKLLCCSVIAWIIIGSIIGFIVIVKALSALSNKMLKGIGHLSEADNKVSRVIKGMKRLADKK